MFPEAHLYDFRQNTDIDDLEMGIRVAAGLLAENGWNDWAPKYDAICRRGYEAIGEARRKIKTKKERI